MTDQVIGWGDYQMGEIHQIKLMNVHDNDPEAKERAEGVLGLSTTTAITFYKSIRETEIEGERFRIMEPIGVVAITKLQPHISEMWAGLSTDIRISPLAFARQCRKMLNQYLIANPTIRLQCYTRDGLDSGARWMTFLGFVWEGHLRKFGSDGCDYNLWARVD